MIEVVQDIGKGRNFILLQEGNDQKAQNAELAKNLAEKSRVIIIKTPVISEINWREISEKVIEQLDLLKIRQASFIARDSVTTVVQNIALSAIRLVRTMVLINPLTRAHPTRWNRFLDWLDSHLPMGVPFASKGNHFDGKSYLQRLRCPVLIIIDNQASQHEISESKTMSKRIPTSWLIHENNHDKIIDMIVNFQDVPAKCPQKNLK